MKVGIDVLSNSKCDVIAIPCNVAHLYCNNLFNMTQIPILNIVNETMKFFEPQVSKVGILGTRGTIWSGIYQEQLLLNDMNIYWNDKFQDNIDELIFKAKELGICNEVLRMWESIESVINKRMSRRSFVHVQICTFAVNPGLSN